MDQSKKTMILPFAKIGFFVGGGVFFILGLVINSGVNNLFGSVSSVTFLNQSLVLFLVLCFGFMFGAAGGALVGIGTPQTVIKRDGA